MPGTDRPPRILIIDDAPHNIELLAYCLGNDGYAISSATSGTEGIENAAAEPPDVILLDVTMPDMDGFETCEALKSRPGLESVPVILISARSIEDDIVRGIEAGAQDFITRPFSMEVVAARVRSVVDGKRSLDLLGELMNEFDDLRHEADSAAAAKAEFLANMSREMRAPMTGVLGMARLVLATELDEEQRDYLETIQDSARSLLGIINDVLDASRADADPGADTVAGSLAATDDAASDDAVTGDAATDDAATDDAATDDAATDDAAQGNSATIDARATHQRNGNR